MCQTIGRTFRCPADKAAFVGFRRKTAGRSRFRTRASRCLECLLRKREVNPASAKGAGRESALLARKQFKHIANATLRRRVARAHMIAAVIWKRWGRGIYRWRLKDVRWFLTCALAGHKRSSKYQYWLVLRSLLVIVGKDRWLRSLKGDWCSPSFSTDLTQRCPDDLEAKGRPVD